MEQILQYSPIIIVVVAYIVQNNLFVKPETLEQKHKEILTEIDTKIKETGLMTPAEFEARRADFSKYISDNYISKETYYYNHGELKEQSDKIERKLDNIDEKIDKRNIEDRKMLLEIMQSIAKKEK